jgi:hypothetical protein
MLKVFVLASCALGSDSLRRYSSTTLKFPHCSAYDGEMTVGFEQEWATNKQELWPTVEASWNPGVDHALIFRTGSVNYQFELQGSDNGDTGWLEAVSDVYKITEKDTYVKALEELDIVHQIMKAKEDDNKFTAPTDPQHLRQVAEQHLVFDKNSSEFKSSGRGGRIIKFRRLKQNGMVKNMVRSPQLTVTYALQNIFPLFSGGFPLGQDMMQTRANAFFRTAVMKDSAEEAARIYESFSQSTTDALSDDAANLVKGYLTLEVQNWKAVSMRPYNKVGTTVYVSGNKSKESFQGPIPWGKDAFGLLLKTPTALILRSLPEDIVHYLRFEKADLTKHFKNILIKSRELRGIKKPVPDDLFRFDDESKVRTIDEYFTLLFDTETPLDEDMMDKIKDTWMSLINDRGSAPIIYPKPPPNGTRCPGLRVAFEYRQLADGSLREAMRFITGLCGEKQDWIPKSKFEQKCTPEREQAMKKEAKHLCSSGESKPVVPILSVRHSICLKNDQKEKTDKLLDKNCEKNKKKEWIPKQKNSKTPK